MTQMQDVFTDLVAESDELEALLADLTSDQWNLPTPSPGWTITDQVAHLAFIFHIAGLAASDPAAFQTEAAPARVDFQAAVDAKLAEFRQSPPAELLDRWRAERAFSTAALAAVPPGEMVPWLVTPLPASVLAAAGMLEVFAHGQDIFDALGVRRELTDRIGHIAFFGARTRDFGYLAQGLTPPVEEFRFELTSPSGAVWAFGPSEATEQVSGPASDFCLLVSRRRHRDDLALDASGAEAERWLDIAQAYRGPSGEGRKPGQFDA
jgi:uncharacterized protein (TIGR03084 family)